MGGAAAVLLLSGRPQEICADATINRVNGGCSSEAERLTVAQDVVGSIPTSRPNEESKGSLKNYLSWLGDGGQCPPSCNRIKRSGNYVGAIRRFDSGFSRVSSVNAIDILIRLADKAGLCRFVEPIKRRLGTTYLRDDATSLDQAR